MIEPKSVNSLVIESEKLKKQTLSELGGRPPHNLVHHFDDVSLFFQEEVLAEWRLSERFDELIEYIVYQYSEQGGEEFWKQILLDLRLKNDDSRAFKLLEGLIPGRLEIYKAKLKNSKKFSDNYLSSASLGIAQGEVLKVLYEYAYILENHPSNKVDTTKLKKIKDQIEKVISKS